MFLAVCSDKGSPGATTAALVLASVWPSPAVVVEADPYGGDLALRLRTHAGTTLPEAPTVLTAATAARTSQSADVVARYAQQVSPVLSVIPGHLMAEQITGVADWQPFAEALAVSSDTVLVDVGRLHASSPMLGVAARADVVLAVGRPAAASVIRMRERLSRLVPALASLRSSPPRLFPVLISPARHGPANLADLRRVLEGTAAGPLVVGSGFLGFDPAAVARLEAGERATGRLARTPLLRTARDLATEVAALGLTPATSLATAAPEGI
jgi:hypothetical protein